MSHVTISIGGSDFPSYASLGEAETYLLPEGTWIAPWTAAPDEDKQKALVRGTRFLRGLEYAGAVSPDDSTGDLLTALESACALLSAFYIANPSAEEGSALVSGSGRVASLSAGGVSISYDTGSSAKQGDTQIAQSDDEIAALRLGIPFLPVFDILKKFLLHPRDTLAADQAAPWRSAPVVQYGTTQLTRQLGISPQDPRYNRLTGQGAWPPSGSRLGGA